MADCDRDPAAFRFDSWPVSGLASSLHRWTDTRSARPSQTEMFGPVALAARVALAYRCGGSTGVSPVSRFTRSHETCAIGHRESGSIVVRF